MEPHVWLVPTLFGVMACSALVLFAAGVVGSVVTRRRPSTNYKFGAAVVLVLLAILAAIVVRATAALLARSLEIGTAIGAVVNLFTFIVVASLLTRGRFRRP